MSRPNSLEVLQAIINRVTADPNERSAQMRILRVQLTTDEIVALIVALNSAKQPESDVLSAALDYVGWRRKHGMRPAPEGEDNQTVGNPTLARILESLRTM
ncbi:MAG: hypothetical protein PVI21_00595 [Candidatus Woesebacteria bacterium]